MNRNGNNFLLRLASLNSVSIAIRFVLGIITSKFIAIFVGVEGMALIGNLRNFLSTVQSFSVLGLTNGIVKSISEHKNNKVEIRKIISTVFILAGFAIIVVSLFCYLKRDFLISYLFGENHGYGKVIVLIPFLIPFIAINLICLAIINGFSKFKRYLYINIASQFVATAFSLILIWSLQLEGALLALLISPAMIFIVTMFYLFKGDIVNNYFKVKRVYFGYAKQLSHFSLMALFSAFCVPLVTIEIRKYIIDTVDIESAGYWEAMQRISNYYLMFVTSLIALYILPKFSAFKLSTDFKREVLHFHKTIIPFFIVGLIIIYFLRTYIIKIVFSEEFLPTEQLFFWQLLGDFIKVLSLIISYQLLAKKMIVYYLFVELFSITTLYILSIYFIDLYGVKGATIAHFFNFCIHYIVILLIFRKQLFSKRPIPI